MKATILCSFSSVDMADLAAGRLRSRIPHIDDIEIRCPSYRHPKNADEDIITGALASVQAAGSAPAPGGAAVSIPITEMVVDSNPDRDSGDSDFIPRDATMRITCRSDLRSDVESMLINLGALKIHSTNDGSSPGSL